MRCTTTLLLLASLTVVPAGAPAAAGGGRLPARLAASPERLALVPSFNRWARAYGIPPDLLKALAWMESGWQNQKVSSVGAVGIGQLLVRAGVAKFECRDDGRQIS